MRANSIFSYIWILACSGCSLVVQSGFHECSSDNDCAGRVDGGSAYCTSDHFCVAQLPEERLCTNGTIGADPNGADTVVIAGMFRLSGDSADKDTEMANAATLAVQEINKYGGSDLRPLAMVLCDLQGDVSLASRSVEKAARAWHAVGSVGPTTSGEILNAVMAVKSSGLLVVSPSATSPAITGLDDNGLIWRTAASDNLQAITLATLPPLLTAGRATKVNVAYVDTPYGAGLNEAFATQWTARSPMNTTPHSFPFTTGSDTDMVAAKLGMDTPDWSLIVADEDASNMVRSLYKLPAGLTATQFLFTDGALGPNLVGTAPVASVDARIQGTAPATPSGSVFGIFQQAYEAAYMADPAATSFVANTYDATYVTAMAVEALSPNDPNPGLSLAMIMSRVSPQGGGGGDINIGPVDLPKAVATLRAGGTIALHGTSDVNLNFDGNGDDVTAPIEVWAIDTTRTPPQVCVRQPPGSSTPCP
jgi:branched-chain amino acid transport system substrate-binding protein